MEKKVQAKHVPEDAILLRMVWFQRKHRRAWMSHWPVREWMTDEETRDWTLASAPELVDVPEKVLLAKLRAMKRKKLIDGCGCGCRGDWEPLEAGWKRLEELGEKKP